MEKIEVFYKQIALGPGNAYHKYIKYTAADGSVFAARGGPNGDGGGILGLGNVITKVGEYIPQVTDADGVVTQKGFVDYDYESDDPSEIIATGTDLSLQWQKIVEAMSLINDAKFPYYASDSNSNTTADAALRYAGLPQPKKDFVNGYWSPGSDMTFSEGDTTTTAGKAFNTWLGLRTADRHITEKLQDLFDALSGYPQRSDPFILDLNGDGISTVPVNKLTPLMFDITGTGTKQSIGWVAPDDGLLVLDRNGNATIDSGAELFGDATTKSNGLKATDGFDALTDLDSNGDSVIDSKDSEFANLRVWRDLNQDGVSQSDELFKLSETGVASINVSRTSHNVVLQNGNVVADLGTYTRTDGNVGAAGTAGQLADVDLAVDTFHSQFSDSLPITDEASALPALRGSGMVRSLQEAASISPDLAGILQKFTAANTAAEQKALVAQILQAWSDTSTMATTFTGAYAGHNLTVDMQGVWSPDDVHVGTSAYQDWATKLTVLERFNGKTYQPVPTGDSDVALTLWHGARDLLQQAYDSLAESVYESLVLQTRLKPYLDQIGVTATAEGQLAFDFSGLDASLANAVSANPTNGITDWLELAKFTGASLQASGWDGLFGLAQFVQGSQAQGTWAPIASALSDSLLHAGAGQLGFLVSDGQSRTFGGAGDDLVIGSSSGDVIITGDGTNTVVAGAGNDTITGGRGSDTYLFSLGDGADTIQEYGNGTDIIRFGAGIAPSDVSLSAALNGRDLIISLANGTDKITVLGYFMKPLEQDYRIEQVQFADGTVWDAAKLATGSVITGTAGNDTITSTGLATTICGGKGDDNIIGGTLSDTYLFNLGDGADTIQEYGNGTDTIRFGAGIAPSDVLVFAAPNGRDLVLQLANGVDSITVLGYFMKPLDQDYKVEQVQFADGTAWDAATLVANGAANIRGTDAADNIVATGIAGGVINAGKGNDTITGGRLSDTYLFNLGDGADTIQEYGNGTDVIRFGAGIAPADVTLSAALNGRDLILSLANGADKITVLGYFMKPYDQDYKVEQVQFADGTVWDAAKLATGAVITGTAGDDTITSTGLATTICGGKGNDTITGGTLSDTYLFNLGDGADTIQEYGNGTDVIRFGAGIAPSDVSLSAALNGRDLILSLANGTDKITVLGYFMKPYEQDYKVEQVQFADGTVWDAAKLATGSVIIGTAGNDTITSTGLATTICGGKGDDNIVGGTLSDTYLFNLGDGADTIQEYGNGTDTIRFGAGIAPYDVTLSAALNGRDLILSLANGSDKITVLGYFMKPYDQDYKVEQVQFADGTVWDAAKLAAGAVITGTAGNDTITSTGLATTISGGKGNDNITGGTLSDTYLFNLGDGADTIQEYGNGTDVIRFGSAIAPGDIHLAEAANGRDLVISHENGMDSITVLGYFMHPSDQNYKIEQVQFADGTVWDSAILDGGATIVGTNTQPVV